MNVFHDRNGLNLVRLNPYICIYKFMLIFVLLHIHKQKTTKNAPKYQTNYPLGNNELTKMKRLIISLSVVNHS